MRKQEKLLRTQSPFEHYILEGYSVRQLSDQLQIKQHRIRRDIQHRLDINQIRYIDEIFPNVQHIMIDGYWLPKMKDEHGYSINRVLLLYYDYIGEKVIWFSIRDRERKEYIVEDLRFLKEHMGYTGIQSCTCDGGVSILAGLRNIYPNILIQRCLIHIQRFARSYVGKRSKSATGKEFNEILSYPILSDAKVFPGAWEDWKERHMEYINEKTRKIKGGKKSGGRYTHDRLRKAIRHIENALPYMFQADIYNLPEIAPTSNKIEGYFGVFAEEGIKEHKGLSPSRLWSFTTLWIYLRNQK